MAKTFNNTRLQQFGQGLMNKVKDVISQSGGVKTVLLDKFAGTWILQGGGTLEAGDVVNIEYASVTRDFVHEPGGSHLGAGIITKVDDMTNSYYIVASDNSYNIITITLRFNGQYLDDQTFTLTNFLTKTSAATTYAKKEDVGRRLAATLSDMSRINDFSGNLNAVGGVNLILSDSSVTPRPGDLIEVTASNGTSIGFQIMASPNAGFFKCMALHINSMNPYIVMLVKTYTGVFSIEAHRVLTATSDNTKTLTQAQYDALTTKDPNTTYFITE